MVIVFWTFTAYMNMESKKRKTKLNKMSLTCMKFVCPNYFKPPRMRNSDSLCVFAARVWFVDQRTSKLEERFLATEIKVLLLQGCISYLFVVQCLYQPYLTLVIPQASALFGQVRLDRFHWISCGRSPLGKKVKL